MCIKSKASWTRPEGSLSRDRSCKSGISALRQSRCCASKSSASVTITSGQDTHWPLEGDHELCISVAGNRDRPRSLRYQADLPSTTNPRRSAARCLRRCPIRRGNRDRYSRATRRAGPSAAYYSGLSKRACFVRGDSVEQRSQPRVQRSGRTEYTWIILNQRGGSEWLYTLS
jgi:hypothetical protein